tara:strand:- start:1129 stop:1311 length:183 start_codon:yes stop_codon:yes gene_type:complete
MEVLMIRYNQPLDFNEPHWDSIPEINEDDKPFSFRNPLFFLISLEDDEDTMEDYDDQLIF